MNLSLIPKRGPRVAITLAGLLSFTAEHTASGANTPLVVDRIDPIVPAPSDGGNYLGEIPYNGGRILSPAPQVVAVFWGPNVDPTTVAKVGNFYSALVNGPFMRFLQEYSVANNTLGTFGTTVVTAPITPYNHNMAIADPDIVMELNTQINLGNLPSPTSATVYMVHFPPGMTISLTLGGQTKVSCQDFCGYHYDAQITCNVGDVCTEPIFYAVIPDHSGSCAPVPAPAGPHTRGCGDRTPFDDLTTSASHELMEALTDPDGKNGWTQTSPFAQVSGEIGDPCNFATLGDGAYTTIFDSNGTAWSAQKGFSNAAFAASPNQSATGAGCVDYPTTACCDEPASSPPYTFQCTWVRSGTSCPLPPAADVMLTIPQTHGLGTPNVTFGPYFNGAEVTPGPFCYKAAGASQPSWCIAVTGVSTTEAITATMGSNFTTSTGVMVNCTTGDCATPLAYATNSSGERVYTLPSRTAAAAPALPRTSLVLCFGLLMALGCTVIARRVG
jgi:hypothetical protein